MTAPTSPGTAKLSVFAVEDTTVQVCWPYLPAPEAVLVVGETRTVVHPDSHLRPGAAVVEGLEPGTDHELVLEVAGRPCYATRFRTLVPPPGDLLSRFATISDLHLGERAFGVLPRLREPRRTREGPPYPVRCASAALAEALAWGAESVIVKGDLTWSGRRGQWNQVAQVLGQSPVPLQLTLGNHDVVAKAAAGGAALARIGLCVTDEPRSVDLPGVRLVVGNSALPAKSRGRVDAAQRAALADLTSGAPGPAFVTLHHYPNRFRVPTRYPSGLPKAEADALLRDLAAANAATMVSFGHSHRHRRYVRHGLPATEVGSTKDYPGVWAGYAVHEGGIRQVVRRISEPSCIAWTERTARALGGFWGLWSPGRCSWRCFTHHWPQRHQGW